MSKSDFCPASRIISALVFAVVAAVLPNLAASWVALGFSILTLFYFRPSFKKLFERWIQINIFIVFIWLVTPWTTPGDPTGPYGFFTVQGIELSALVTIKANALFFVFYALVSALSFTRLAAGLQTLRLSNKLTAILLFCARGIEIFETEYRHMVEAMKLRGFQMRADKRTYQTVGAVIALLFSRAIRKSTVLEEAMLLRGYDGVIRTVCHEKWHLRDSCLLAVYICASIILIYCGWR